MKTRSIFGMLLATAPVAAGAVTPLTTGSSVTVVGSVTTAPSLVATRTIGNGTTSVAGTTSATGVTLNSFDTNTGILVGGRVSVSGVNTAVNAVVAGSGQVASGGRTADAVSTLVGSVSGAGFSISNASASASRNCSGGNCPNSPSNTGTSNPAPALSGNATIAAPSLAAYATNGAGSIELARSASGTSAITLNNFTNGSSAASYTFTGGTFGIAYDYLNFAAPSFNGSAIVTSIVLDFGSRALNSAPATLNFSLFNTGSINSAGLSLVSITRDNNNSVFTTDLGVFTNSLDAGAQRSYSATLDPIVLGNQIDRFRLVLQDFAPAGSVGMRQYSLDVVTIAYVGAVPEPSSWAMLITGFGLVGTSMRRRRTVAAA